MQMADDKIFGKPDNRTKLHQHFENVDAGQQTGVWDEVWQKQITPWDRSAPSPALVDTLRDKAEILGSPVEGLSSESQAARLPRKKALVPGCGRGYDVLLFTSYGYDAYGLDVSQTAVDAARRLEQETGDDQSKYPPHDGVGGRGNATFVFGDFFRDDFLSETHGDVDADQDRKFDVIYDYTFLCALPPELRPKWAKRMTELLKPNGHLICLEFPLFKAPNLGGPPHGLSSVLYEQLFAHPGREVRYDDSGYACEDRSAGVSDDALVRGAHWTPERTHEVGKGTDRVSIWQPRRH